MLLCQKITDKYSYFSKQVEYIYPLLAYLKINAFPPQAAVVLVFEHFTESKFLVLFFSFSVPKCDRVLNLDLLTSISTSSKSVNRETLALLICDYFRQFSVQSRKLTKDLRVFLELFALEFYYLIYILMAEMSNNMKII